MACIFFTLFFPCGLYSRVLDILYTKKRKSAICGPLFIIKSGCDTVSINHECNWILNFQVLARFMVMLNFVVPIVSILFIQTGYSSSLNICLGEGYLNFFSTQAQLCTQESSCLCWVWTTILAIGNSKFQINKCLFFWQN